MPLKDQRHAPLTVTATWPSARGVPVLGIVVTVIVWLPPVLMALSSMTGVLTGYLH